MAAGMHVMEREHECTILCGIPSKLAMFMSTILVTAQVSNTSTDLNALANHICKEADCLKLWSVKEATREGAKRRPLMRPWLLPPQRAAKDIERASATTVASLGTG